MVPRQRARCARPHLGVPILERLEPETSEALATYADPLMLATALIAWGVQISRILAARREEEAAAEDMKKPLATPPIRKVPSADDLKVDKIDGDNGHHEDEAPVPDYTQTGEAIPATEISRLMGDGNG